ncbi:MAG: hypothetical protein O3A63_02505 [Proteobacteria bacterium]|nr:hypothetical protein [Pseudomonadota bacterium]
MTLEILHIYSLYVGFFATSVLVLFLIVNLIRGISGRAALLAGVASWLFVAVQLVLPPIRFNYNL